MGTSDAEMKMATHAFHSRVIAAPPSRNFSSWGGLAMKKHLEAYRNRQVLES
jgi:hypothetical protein